MKKNIITIIILLIIIVGCYYGKYQRDNAITETAQKGIITRLIEKR